MCPEFEADDFENDRDYLSNLHMNWFREVREPLVPPFTGESGLKVELETDATPLEHFNVFLNNTDMTNIAFETNRYFSQIRAQKVPSCYSRMNSWVDTSGNEIAKFLGMTILMGLVDKHCISSYWSTDKHESTLIYGTQMTRDRFMSILSFLHLADNSIAPSRLEDGFDPLYKLGSATPILRTRTSPLTREWSRGEDVCGSDSTYQTSQTSLV
ncbi:piggyBac transposable element-derived protein 2-like [Dreissena polymorpha]|uniref:piggyBac transposable element-derived protein 2-like n=1 Tax=Dreissena polymorpha TaxID=45954 RepID=UPI00226562C2|nr:piggyBac transposable element-derived protein 2-like [Dreissena polymorpha]